MAKQKIKLSEARILVYLKQVKADQRFACIIAAKLGVDYAYIRQILKQMHIKGWIRKEDFGVKRYWFLTRYAPLKESKELI